MKREFNHNVRFAPIAAKKPFHNHPLHERSFAVDFPFSLRIFLKGFQVGESV
jgi:hypothetical protein